MTAQRAKEILRRVWGFQNTLSPEEYDELRRFERPAETAIEILERIAGVHCEHPARSAASRQFYANL